MHSDFFATQQVSPHVFNQCGGLGVVPPNIWRKILTREEGTSHCWFARADFARSSHWEPSFTKEAKLVSLRSSAILPLPPPKGGEKEGDENGRASFGKNFSHSHCSLATGVCYCTYCWETWEAKEGSKWIVWSDICGGTVVQADTLCLLWRSTKRKRRRSPRQRLRRSGCWLDTLTTLLRVWKTSIDREVQDYDYEEEWYEEEFCLGLECAQQMFNEIHGANMKSFCSLEGANKKEEKEERFRLRRRLAIKELQMNCPAGHLVWFDFQQQNI